MVKEAFVSLEVAKLLQEKGFDIECNNAYYNGRLIDYTMYGFCGALDFIFTPTQQMAMAWLREVHDIETCVEYSIPDDAYNYTIIVKNVTNGFTIIHSEGTYEVYEKATDELLKYCLENLI